jgi:pre-mRNA-processing factor SLU7
VEGDATKRKFNSIEGGEVVTAEEMEAFRLKKGRTDDPMEQAAAAAGTSGYDLLE